MGCDFITQMACDLAWKQRLNSGSIQPFLECFLKAGLAVVIVTPRNELQRSVPVDKPIEVIALSKLVTFGTVKAPNWRNRILHELVYRNVFSKVTFGISSILERIFRVTVDISCWFVGPNDSELKNVTGVVFFLCNLGYKFFFYVKFPALPGA